MGRQGDAEGLARDGLRRRLEAGGREDEDDARAARPAAGHDPRPGVRGDRLPAREGPHHRPADRRRIAADGDDVAAAAARESVLHRRRADHRVLPDRHDGLRRAAAEHARQQPAVVARDRASRDDSRPQPRPVHGTALCRLSRESQRGRPVLRRGLAAVLGSHALRHGLQQDAGGTGRRARLADAPLRAHHLLAQVPHGPVVAAGSHRLPRRSRRPRARQRDGRGAAVVRSGRRLRPALPGRLPARRPPDPRPAPRAGGLEADDREGLPRRDPPPGQHADRAAPARADEAEADARHEHRLAVLRSRGRTSFPQIRALGARGPMGMCPIDPWHRSARICGKEVRPLIIRP